MDRLALRIRVNKLEGHPLEAVVLLHELTPESTIKEGYLIINDRDCCWHVWVENRDGAALDINYKLATLKDPEFGSCKVERVYEKPKDLQIHEDQEMIDRFRLPIRDFWKSAPKKYQDFRGKIKKLWQGTAF